MTTTEILEMTTTENTDIKESAFYLEKKETSIYDGLICREYPSLEMIYGFIEKQMGVRLRLKFGNTFEDEQTNYKNYINLYVYLYNLI